jgi:alkylhydroperoxidase family enzyme
MALVRTIDESEAEGELAEVYKRIAGASGSVANILKAESLAPRALAAHYALYRELMFGQSPLGRAQRELIAVAVSHANSCHY